MQSISCGIGRPPRASGPFFRSYSENKTPSFFKVFKESGDTLFCSPIRFRYKRVNLIDIFFFFSFLLQHEYATAGLYDESNSAVDER